MFSRSPLPSSSERTPQLLDTALEHFLKHHISRLPPPYTPAMTTPTPQNLGARLRKTFRYEGDDDDDDIHYMDEQEQEVLITQLIQEDAKRNQFYSVPSPPSYSLNTH